MTHIYPYLTILITICLWEMAFAQHPGEPVPPITFTDNSGKLLSLNTLQNNYVYLNFDKSGCPDCAINRAHLVTLQQKYFGVPFKNANGFRLITVWLDTDKTAWVNTLNEYRSPWPNICDFKGEQSPNVTPFGVSNIPTSFLISPDGFILQKNISITELDQFLVEKANFSQNHYKVCLGTFGLPEFHDFAPFEHLGNIDFNKRIDINGEVINEVFIGPFYSKEEAQTAWDIAQQNAYQDAFIVGFRKGARINYAAIEHVPTDNDFFVSEAISVYQEPDPKNNLSNYYESASNNSTFVRPPNIEQPPIDTNNNSSINAPLSISTTIEKVEKKSNRRSTKSPIAHVNPNPNPVIKSEPVSTGTTPVFVQQQPFSTNTTPKPISTTVVTENRPVTKPINTTPENTLPTNTAPTTANTVAENISTTPNSPPNLPPIATVPITSQPVKDSPNSKENTINSASSYPPSSTNMPQVNSYSEYLAQLKRQETLGGTSPNMSNTSGVNVWDNTYDIKIQEEQDMNLTPDNNYLQNITNTYGKEQGSNTKPQNNTSTPNLYDNKHYTPPSANTYPNAEEKSKDSNYVNEYPIAIYKADKVETEYDSSVLLSKKSRKLQSKKRRLSRKQRKLQRQIRKMENKEREIDEQLLIRSIYDD